MTAVRAFKYDKRLWKNYYRLLKALRMAVIWAVTGRFVFSQRNKRFRQDAFVIYIPAGLCQPLRRALLRAKKKIIHMYNAAAGFFLQF